jgi:nucleoside-diphosphate-sugar epimerase
VHDSLASLDRIRRVLGYCPSVPFQEGLRRTVEATARSVRH